jgi:3-methyladenine DNA glycosylase/8-oxoguanine DNA glycosylase
VATTRARSREVELGRPLDVWRTLCPLRHGRGDPAFRILDGSVWRATRTPDGPGTQRLWVEGRWLRVEAWGAGADWLIDRAAVLVGEGRPGWETPPHHPLLRELGRRHPGLRIPRSEAVFEAVLGTVLEQRVAVLEAARSWRALLRALGEPAPGPLPGLVVPPAPAVVAATPSFVFRRFGVDARRAETVRRAARVAARLEETVAMPLDAARRRLLAVPGLGLWTAAGVALAALGDADAVPVGDCHLPHLVSWALAGEPRGSNARMLELLEPYRGHRGLVVRLLLAGGVAAPRRGPRRPLPGFASG